MHNVPWMPCDIDTSAESCGCTLSGRLGHVWELGPCMLTSAVHLSLSQLVDIRLSLPTEYKRLPFKQLDRMGVSPSSHIRDPSNIPPLNTDDIRFPTSTRIVDPSEQHFMIG
jgi:hypothetical protein